jgi:hypothetical protein
MLDFNVLVQLLDANDLQANPSLDAVNGERVLRVALILSWPTALR